MVPGHRHGGSQRDTGIRVAMTQRGSGETLAQIRAEAQNPRGDVWWGGTGDPHVAAGEERLTQAYESPRIAELYPWALAQWRQTHGRTVGVYASVLGFGFNTELVARRNARAALLGRPADRASAARSRSRTRTPPAPPTSSSRRWCS